MPYYGQGNRSEETMGKKPRKTGTPTEQLETLLKYRMLSGGCKGPHSANHQGQSNPGRNKLRSDRCTRSPLSRQWKASNQRPNRGANRALRADICPNP